MPGNTRKNNITTGNGEIVHVTPPESWQAHLPHASSSGKHTGRAPYLLRASLFVAGMRKAQ